MPESSDPKIAALRKSADERRNARTMSTLLMSAYLQAKALHENLTLLSHAKTTSGFSYAERVAIGEAHKAAAAAYTELNRVIVDQGNELGLNYTKELLEKE